MAGGRLLALRESLGARGPQASEGMAVPGLGFRV